MKRKDRVYEFLRRMKAQYGNECEYTATEIATAIGASRANVSSDLNRLLEENLVEKSKGRPVRYRACLTVITPIPIKREKKSDDGIGNDELFFNSLIGYDGSLRMELEKAKAGVLYPPNGLPMLIVGETGVGKTMFARLVFEYAKQTGSLASSAKFITFNCADYAANPQLLASQLFGHIKGAFTGADKDKAGLVEEADGGVLFLDEVHRLPPEAQEALFTIMDFGQFHRLGEAVQIRSTHPLIILATTDTKNTSLLGTFRRRIPINITIPSLSQRNVFEKLKLVEACFKAESRTLSMPIRVDSLVVKALLAYDCPGNIGQLKNDIKVICARAYVKTLISDGSEISILIQDLAPNIKAGLSNIKGIYSDINLIVTNFLFQPSNLSKTKEEAYDIYDYISKNLSVSLEGEQEENVENSLQDVIALYFWEHMKNSENHNELLSIDVIQVVHQSVVMVNQRLSVNMTENDQKVLAILVAMLKKRVKLSKNTGCPFLHWVRINASAEFEVAQEIISLMNLECTEEIKLNSAGFIASFLLQLGKKRLEEIISCGVFVVCYGTGSAHAMVKVANEILGSEYVGWYDITHDYSTPMDDKQLMEEAKRYLGEKGGIVLYDDPFIKAWAEGLKELLNLPVYAIGNVQTSMVIEAAIEAYEMKNSTFYIYERLQYMSEQIPMQKRLITGKGAKEQKVSKRKAIVTACFSGCGVAKKIKQIIEKKFVLPLDVEIFSMDTFLTDSIQENIAKISETYQIVCIIGLEVEINLGIPFISANDFILGSGESKLLDIMDINNIEVYPTKPLPTSRNEYEKAIINWQYLEGVVYYLNTKTLIPYVEEAIDGIEKIYGKMEEGKYIMLLIHICCMVERLVFEPSSLPQDDYEDYTYPKEELSLAMSTIEKAYKITIPAHEYQMIAQMAEMIVNEN